MPDDPALNGSTPGAQSLRIPNSSSRPITMAKSAQPVADDRETGQCSLRRAEPMHLAVPQQGKGAMSAGDNR